MLARGFRRCTSVALRQPSFSLPTRFAGEHGPSRVSWYARFGVDSAVALFASRNSLRTVQDYSSSRYRLSPDSLRFHRRKLPAESLATTQKICTHSADVTAASILFCTVACLVLERYDLPCEGEPPWIEGSPNLHSAPGQSRRARQLGASNPRLGVASDSHESAQGEVLITSASLCVGITTRLRWT